LEPVTTDDCSCDAGDCSGISTWIQLHTCVRSISGYTGCNSVSGQHIGYYWECTEYPDYLGILECWLLNKGVCAFTCAAALAACTTLEGVDVCPDLAIACNECLNNEGIDCGCLTVICDYPEEATDKIYGSDQKLSGEICCP
jgi:hypothetical protein